VDSTDSLVGRGRELSEITRFLDGAATDGAALLLLGDAGIGKSVLLDAAVEQAVARGARVLRSAGAEFESDIGFSALHQLLAPVLGERGRLDPVHRGALTAALGYSAGPIPGRLIVSTAVLDLLRLVAADRPLLVVVDDAPWLDRASAAVVGFVARRLTGSRIGLVVAARSGGEPGWEGYGLPAVEVAPLDDEASAALVDRTFPALAPAVRHRVLAEAGGNPLALLELPAALTGRQQAAADPLPSVLPLGRRLQAVFADQLAGLPAPTLQVLLLAALEGRGDMRQLTAAAGPGSIDDLAPAERAGVVRIDEDADRLAFRHPLVRAAVVELATSADRRMAHRMLADALLGHSERRAWHLAGSTVGFDEKVAGLLEQAARFAHRRGDTAGAVSALLRSAQLSPHGADRGRRLARAAYVGVVVTGGLRQVPQLILDAQQADPDCRRSLQVASASASLLLLSGDVDVDTAHQLLVAAIESYPARHDPDDEPLAEALQTLFMVCVYGGGRLELWGPFEKAVARIAPRIPDVVALGWRVSADPARVTREDLADLEAAVRSLRDETDPARIVRVARAATFVDRVSACRDALWRVVDDGRAGGAVAVAIKALALLAFDRIGTGHWDEADRLADEGLELCRVHGYSPVPSGPFWLVKGLIAARRGDRGAMRALADHMLCWAAPRNARVVLWHAFHTLGTAALGHADFEDAYRHTTRIGPPGALPRYVPLALWSAMDLVEAAVHTGRREEAHRHVAVLQESGVAAISSRIALLVGGAAAIASSGEEATRLFEDVLALPGAQTWPFERARIQLAYGEHLRRTRAITAARTHLTGASDAFTRLGAGSWAERAGKELRATGRGPGQSSLLSAQEQEIALLAATGLTNKQIAQQLSLSHRTVGAHLYRIFPKLGIASRAALRDALEAETGSGQSSSAGANRASASTDGTV
jgi:DNA-binding NarL/FixJ family response regulator